MSKEERFNRQRISDLVIGANALFEFDEVKKQFEPVYVRVANLDRTIVADLVATQTRTPTYRFELACRNGAQHVFSIQQAYSMSQIRSKWHNIIYRPQMHNGECVNGRCDCALLNLQSDPHRRFKNKYRLGRQRINDLLVRKNA